MVEILQSEYGDLAEILSLQKLAYQSEAKLVNDFSISPLTQTIAQLEDDFRQGTILKGVAENIIIGSVRGKAENEVLHIGRLMVHPDYQNKGIGTKLLLAIEQYYPNMTYQLFTSNLSEKNIELYTKNGYVEFKRTHVNEKFDFVYLHKRNPVNKH